jgi:hypothetical protein
MYHDVEQRTERDGAIRPDVRGVLRK